MAIAGKKPDQPKPLSSAAVLLVEDQPFSREVVSRALQHIGVGRIMTAPSSEDALYNLEKTPGLADVAILDYRLPGKNGLQLLEALRDHENEALKHLPVVVLTGKNDLQLYKKMALLGISAFLLKPVAAESLKQALEAALSGYRAPTPRGEPPVIVPPRREGAVMDESHAQDGPAPQPEAPTDPEPPPEDLPPRGSGLNIKT